jgi:hypothetical protein
MDFQLTEAAAEFDMAFVGELLAAEIDHNIVMESQLDFRKGPVIQFRGEIEQDFCAAGVAALGH